MCSLLLLMLPTTTWAKTKEHQGADAGYLVYPVGTVRIGMHFDCSYRRVVTVPGTETHDWHGKIQPKLGGAIYLEVKNPDLTGEETGHVVVKRLQPGKHEVHSFAFSGSTPVGGSVRWSPGTPFALPFSIRSGEATYIGSFMRSPSLGTPLQQALDAAGFFVSPIGGTEIYR